MSGEGREIYDWQAQLDFPEAMSDLQAIPEPAELQATTPEDAERATAINRAHTINQLQVRIAGLALMIGLGASVATGIKSLEGGNHQEPHYATPGPCGPPSPQAVKAVEALFGGNHISTDPMSAAQETGVHLNPNSQPGTTEDTTTTPRASITWANYNLRPFGITIQDGVPSGKDDGLTNPTKAELDKNVNPVLDEITQPLTYLPIELLHLTGIKKIILMANPKSDIAFRWDNPQTLVWNIDSQPYPEEMTRALYQGVDTTECYFSGGDPDYTNLSGGGVVNIYGPHGQRQGLLSLDQFATITKPPEYYGIGVENSLMDPYAGVFNSAVSAAYKRGNQTGDYAEYCSLVNHYLEQIVVADQEDFQSAYEDKSDLGSMLLDVSNDNYDALLNPHSPVIRKKALFLLSRLYDADPNVVRYIAADTGRSNGSLENCQQAQ